MDIKPGTLLISTPLLKDSDFAKTVIFITAYNKKGALGFVVNRIFPRAFNELVEFKNAVAFPLFEGGPMENDNIFFVHCRPDLIEDGSLVTDSIYMGGDFKQAVVHINNAGAQQKDIKLFIGYCGWDDNQLEEEIEEGSWLIGTADTQIIFSTDVKMLWEKIYNGL